LFDAFIPVTRRIKGYLYSGKCIYQVEECVSDPRLYAKYSLSVLKLSALSFKAIGLCFKAIGLNVSTQTSLSVLKLSGWNFLKAVTSRIGQLNRIPPIEMLILFLKNVTNSHFKCAISFKTSWNCSTLLYPLLVECTRGRVCKRAEGSVSARQKEAFPLP